MTHRPVIPMAFAVFALLLALPGAAHGQFVDKLKDRAKHAAEAATLNQVGRMVRGKVRCMFNDWACMEDAEASGKGYVLTEEDGEIMVDEDGNPVTNSTQLPPDMQATADDLYDVLEAKGRIAVRDILFDTGEATIKPESEAALSKIGTMLQQHADLSMLIEGHTDNPGGFDMNMELSSGRAAAVKAYLVETYEIDGTRLRTMGLGSTQPVAGNDTPEGQQQNRRVELVRL